VIYNPLTAVCAEPQMQTTRYPKLEERWAVRLLVGIVVCALALSLATRFSLQASPQVHTVRSVESGSLDPMRRRLSQDAVRWVGPIATASCIEPFPLSLEVTPSQPAFLDHLFIDRVLCNRPPPSSRFFV
jgi:hypothetical protein